MKIDATQVQTLLLRLGHSPGLVDGVWGTMSQTALESALRELGGEVSQPEKLKEGYAEQYLKSDGYYHIPKGVNVRLTKNFSSKEVECQGKGCCTETVISKRIMDTAQAIRDEIDEPLEIGGAGGSGYRCQKHNADPNVKGAANSLHLISDAVDLHYRNPAKLKSVALRHVKDGEVGIYSWGCHVGLWNRGVVSQFTGNS